jgi:rfaE bifunctional protein nucleotidyltransferase chain/domain
MDITVDIYRFPKDSKEIERQIIIERMNYGSSISFTNGCFDILHKGHIKLLTESSEFGTFHIVGINSDQSVNRLKGDNRPINNEDDRAELLSNLRCVDMVVIYDDDTPNNLLELIKPNTLVKGGEYTIEDLKDVGGDIVTKNGGVVEIIPMVKGISTSRIIMKINEQD